MRRRSKLVTLAAVVLALATLGLTSGGSAAAPAASKPTRQDIAKRLLNSRRSQFMTPAALAAVTMIANGSKDLSPTGRSPEAEDLRPEAKAATSAAPLAAATLPNVRVNDPGRDRTFIDQTTQSETTIAVHGANVAVGYNDSQHSLLFLTAATNLTGYSFSTNGGLTFTDGGVLPNAPGYQNLGDPWMASNRAGRFFYATLANTPDFNLGVSVARSSNGGRTWSNPREVSPSAGALIYLGDKEAMTTGRDPLVASRDNTYVAWDDFSCDFTFTCFDGLPVARSTDDGLTWQVTYADKFQEDPSTCTFQQYIGAQPFVDTSNGLLYVAAERIRVDDPTCSGGTLEFSQFLFKSADGGQTFGPGVKIADVTPATPLGFLPLGQGKGMRTIEFPVLARIGGTLYAAWNDGGQGPSHIRLASSTDRGATWSLAWATSGGKNELQPALSTSGGALHLAYYSIAANNLIDVLLQDRNGSTVTTRRVSTKSFPGVPNLPQFDPVIADAYMGDYIANVSAGGHEYLAWGDNRDKVQNALWSTARNDPDVFFAKR
jgi:hypothetical protein